jgi:hypothetical protein
MSAARRDLDWSAASARLLFDGDDAVLHNTVQTPSSRGHRSLPAAAARFLRGRTLTVVESVYSAVRTDSLYKANYVSSFKG